MAVIHENILETSRQNKMVVAPIEVIQKVNSLYY